MEIQSKESLDAFYNSEDPWGYLENEADTRRREILLSEISSFSANRVLDIGCGNGFVTNSIGANQVVGVDFSDKAIEHARKLAPPQMSYKQGSILDLKSLDLGKFDLIIITGVLYPQYVGTALTHVYRQIDELLESGGHLVSVHIANWYAARFPYILSKTLTYPYRDYNHKFEVYVK